jgi:hypothetical protein
MLDAARRTKATLYVIAAFYVAIGFFVAIPAAMNGDRLSAFLGFLIISGALACTFILRSILRLADHVCTVSENAADVTDNLERLTKAVASLAAAAHESASMRLVDLAAFGRGDPDLLAAARLDRDAYPRLVTTLDDDPQVGEPKVHAGERPGEEVNQGGAARDVLAAGATPAPVPGGAPARMVTTKNLLEEWKSGIRNGDLIACRAVYAALVDLVEPDALTPLTQQLDGLTAQAEQALRRLFTDCARRRDIEGMLEIGERIARLLPDRPAAREFRELRPFLRIKLEAGFPAKPPLRLVH